MTEDIQLEKVEYWREVRPPTLKQYLYRRAVRERMALLKGKTGVTVDPKKGRPIPEAALLARDALKGLTSEKILEEHPEWAEEYAQEHGGRDGKGAANLPPR